MTTVRTVRRAVGAGLAALALAVSATACSSGGPGSVNGPYMVWDPYPQLGSTSAWAQALTTCANAAGASIKRSSYNDSDLVGKETAAEGQGLSPDLLIVNNLDVSALVSANDLTTTAQNNLDTSAFAPNLLAGGQVHGSTYGAPIGANTLALYYNKSILSAAGVDPTSITSWAALDTALAKVKAINKTGITFSAIGTEEGSFQFEPWLWGAGASLNNLSSPQAVAALNLWTKWVKDGYAPSSVLNDTQAASWQEFAAGDTAFSENTPAQLAGSAGGVSYGVINIPSQNGGVAPTPTGGEVITVPVQTGTNRYAVDDKIISCLTNTANAYSIDTELNYVGATTAVQAEQGTKTPALAPWITAVQTAKAGPSDSPSAGYSKVSTQLWTAIQAALNGSASPQSALDTAQRSVG